MGTKDVFSTSPHVPSSPGHSSGEGLLPGNSSKDTHPLLLRGQTLTWEAQPVPGSLNQTAAHCEWLGWFFGWGMCPISPVPSKEAGMCGKTVLCCRNIIRTRNMYKVCLYQGVNAVKTFIYQLQESSLTTITEFNLKTKKPKTQWPTLVLLIALRTITLQLPAFICSGCS